MTKNPFLDPAFRVRWAELKPGLVGPAVDEALAQAESALRGIEASAGDPTFEDTYLALDAATDALNSAWRRVMHLQSVADSPEMREAYNRALPRVSAFGARVPLRQALWARLRAFADSPSCAGLQPVRARFVAETLAAFREAGADLPADRRARLEALQIELSELTQRYSEHVLDATNAWQLIVDDGSRLAGLPAHARARALAEASAKGIGTAERPSWRFTLHMPSLQPFMTYLDDDGLREEMWRAASSVGSVAPNDNTPLVSRILSLRAEKAALLGRGHFADLVLGRRMAKSGKGALDFIDGLRARCLPAFEGECRRLEESTTAGTGAPARRLAPWEVMYQAERLRRASYDFDEEELRPYFPMDRVMAGLFELTGRIFAIRVVEHP
ncbi:MAG TPA: M3 family metallopeptidase, partial [Opitutaceae bacterium]|nr:M3 family metallopeptidase [Opitutaceae bacterium]